jgi:hypothetical protein
VLRRPQRISGEKTIHPLATLVGALALAFSTGASGSFDSAVSQARLNEASAEGQEYQSPLYQVFGPVLQQTMQRCFPADSSTTEPQFTLVFRVRRDGGIGDLMGRPESNALACVVDGIASVRLPTPPRPDWWILLEMKVTQ